MSTSSLFGLLVRLHRLHHLNRNVRIEAVASTVDSLDEVYEAHMTVVWGCIRFLRVSRTRILLDDLERSTQSMALCGRTVLLVLAAMLLCSNSLTL
jgi:hypothetical protein